jgi:hypothetical protein
MGTKCTSTAKKTQELCGTKGSVDVSQLFTHTLILAYKLCIARIKDRYVFSRYRSPLTKANIALATSGRLKPQNEN